MERAAVPGDIPPDMSDRAPGVPRWPWVKKWIVLCVYGNDVSPAVSETLNN